MRDNIYMAKGMNKGVPSAARSGILTGPLDSSIKRDLGYVERRSMDLESMTVETDLFEHREVKPHFINPCCFGEDFAKWLRHELADLAP